MKLYQRFFKYIYRNLQYINDFPNISIVTYNISTVRQKISIYRQTLTLKKYFIIKRLPKIWTTSFSSLFHTSKLCPSSYII
ncbi:hypothetical protein COD05_24765 [Bacillus cereus]|nr:hypothetical protein CN431_21510 [Bacillus cereus]PFW77827.1 hypothetical protein COL27_25220 [Bacillus sp. AFS075960]PFF84133.1 hypothetical protein CN338_25155 [Bacillus cereus]PFM90504.1 hypothetical protein COJ53_11105 [Bacillus cereus]PFQ93642.1 hypothetical protein COK28_04790 [Bacillus cereus]